ncbi:MAG: response regulator, partial [Candidatus Bathyarchaeota archaeon]|nr:response regulator [Candidatus Bathyarchaeota archaeon]
SRKRGILIVDDDATVLDTLKEYLTSEGYVVETSGTGADALKKFKKKFFDVTLLDIKLPDMDGLQLLTKIHAQSPKTMNIMVTGYPSLNNAVASLNLGAVSYIMKPINPDELLFYIQSKLEQVEHDDKSSNVLDNTMPVFFELLSDCNWWSTDTLAEKMGISKEIVEKMCSFCARTEIVNYWPSKHLVKIEKPGTIPKAS